MLYSALPLDRRSTILENIVTKYYSRGFNVISRTSTTAELYKPKFILPFVRREQTVYLDVDEKGRVFVRKI